MEYTDIANEYNPNRKAIVFENHDVLLGKGTDGTQYNLAMISKWNKADFGSASVPFNMNGSEERPTYNDEKEIALLNDVQSIQIPEKLPNPESLTIKYNGKEAFSYDGSKPETGNFIVNANTVPMSEEDATTIAAKFVSEESTRNEIVTKLQEQIEAETEARSTKDAELQTNLATESSTARNAEKANADAIAQEVSDRKSEDEKIIKMFNTISLEKQSNLEYSLKVGDVIVGTINIPEDQFLKEVEYNSENKSIAFTFNTSSGETSTSVDVSDLVDTYVAGNGLEMDENAFSVKIDSTTQKYIEVSENGVKIVGIDEALANIPTKLPNPESLTIKYNGVEAFSYDGSKSEIGNFIVNAETVPMSGTDTTTISNKINTLATKQEVELKADKTELETVKEDVEHLKESYSVNLTNLLSAEDSETISNAIGGIDNLKNTINQNQVIVGTINNGEVSVSIRNLGNVTSLYYILDTLAGYTVNEINITNTNGTLSKNIKSHSMMTEEMVVDNLTTEQSTLPLSANQGKVLNDTKANKTELENLATKTELNKVANSKLYYPGVKVDTQKLFALTKESSETEIKEALQIKVASGSYTLPTSAILDECLGKGYQLLSNWMPVSIVWNGAAYVFYVVGQNYMMKPTGLYTVALSITEDGKYSVFQAAKCEEFANVEDLNEYQKIDTLLPEDTFETATSKVANGVKTIIDSDGLQWFITQAYEGVIDSTNALKVIAVRVKSPYVTTDTIQSSYGLVYAQFTLAEGAAANSWSRVTSNGEFISEYTVNNLIDEKLINVNNAITLLNDKVSILENKYNMILEENSESIADFVGGDTINDTTKSYCVSNANIESNSTINAKNIVLNDSTLSNDARLKVNSNNIEVNNININGDFPKENGNSVISLNDAEYVVFKNMTFNSNNVYNGVEIGLNSEKLPKNVLFENCKFEGTFSNNAILVFGTQNNATITLSNCTFDKLSNALRLSNKSNASGITVNIINCSVNQWEETNKEYGGFLICEDYTSDASSVDSNNLFGNGKITVNFMNLTHKGEKVIYSNASRCCGTKDENQVVYVYADNVGFVNYSEDKYPIVTFK